MTGSIEALGLIYTNVEAKDSPTGQRGFQVWQASVGLSAEARKEISRRVDDYRLPTGVTPEAAAEYGRDSYFRLSDKAGGGFGVARSVPLAGKDKFGRGGRFLAHVLVVTAADFEALHCDPFALFDAAPFLSGEPEQLAKDRPEWVKGVLPVTTLTPVATAGDCLPGDVRAQLAGHVDRDAAQRKTVVVVAMPAAVVAVLRTAFRGMPPALRASAEFDTMSAGSSLTQVPCAFAGCPSAAVLKMWAFRRFVTFTPPGIFTPASELQKPDHELRAALTGTAAWAEATDCARAAAWGVAAAVGAGRLADAGKALKATGGRDAEELVLATPSFAATYQALKRDWLANCPATVAAVPGVRDRLERELCGTLGGVLGRLQGQVPHEELAEIVLEKVALKLHRGADGDLGHIQAWNGKDHADGSFGRRLDWVLSRLQGHRAAELRDQIGGEVTADSEWLRKWTRASMKKAGHTAATLLERLAHELPDDQLDADALDEAGLYLQCATGEPEDLMRDLHFRYACRVGGLADLLTDGELPEVGECLAYLRRRSVLGWTMLPDYTYFSGAFVYPDSMADADLLRAVHESGITGREALPILFPAAARNHGDTPPRLPEPTKPLRLFLDRLSPSKGGKTPEGARLLGVRKEFAAGGELLFREAARYLTDQMIREARAEYEPGESTRAAGLFGLRLKWGLPELAKGCLPELLQVVLGAAGPELDRDWPPSAEGIGRDPAEFARLLSWM